VTDVARLRALAFAARRDSGCSDGLGDALVSVILHGSLTLDDFTPRRSDTPTVGHLPWLEDPASFARIAREL
jgi:hypothetical protein